MSDELRKLAEAAPEIVAALRSQQQLDMDGTIVGVSRQACEEGATLIAALTARVAELERDANRLDHGLRTIMDACGDGSICDDVVWFDEFTTLFDHCASILGDRLPQEEYEAIVNGKRRAAAMEGK